MDTGIKESSAKPARVLIVEDNPDQAALMERWLANRAHYEVVVAADGLTGSIIQRPCSRPPSSAAKQAPESNRGQHSQSIEPARETRAAVSQSPISA